MAKKETTSYAAPLLPMLKTVEQMSKVVSHAASRLTRFKQQMNLRIMS